MEMHLSFLCYWKHPMAWAVLRKLLWLSAVAQVSLGLWRLNHVVPSTTLPCWFEASDVLVRNCAVHRERVWACFFSLLTTRGGLYISKPLPRGNVLRQRTGQVCPLWGQDEIAHSLLCRKARLAPYSHPCLPLARGRPTQAWSWLSCPKLWASSSLCFSLAGRLRRASEWAEEAPCSGPATRCVPGFPPDWSVNPRVTVSRAGYNLLRILLLPNPVPKTILGLIY